MTCSRLSASLVEFLGALCHAQRPWTTMTFLLVLVTLTGICVASVLVTSVLFPKRVRFCSEEALASASASARPSLYAKNCHKKSVPGPWKAASILRPHFGCKTAAAFHPTVGWPRICGHILASKTGPQIWQKNGPICLHSPPRNTHLSA